MRKFKVVVNGASYEVEVEEITSDADAQASSAPSAQPAAPEKPKAAIPAGSTPVKAPLQGTVLKVCVQVGDEIRRGTPVCVIEAMKMENDVPAPKDGRVAAVMVKKGDTVKSDEILVTLA